MDTLIDSLDREWLAMAAARLRKLKRDTDRVVNALDPQKIEGTINWGDLHCKEAALVIGEHYTGYRVTVEEADPNCPKLHEAVRDGLNRCGWFGVDVEIETAW